MTASPTKKAKRAARGIGQPVHQLKPFTVALVGRPNVGKSSLFNRLTGTRLAIVDDTPGTTRDWKEAAGRIGGLHFTVMDTGGLEDKQGRDTIESRMLDHTRAAIGHADVVLFIVDAKAGVTSEDEAFARWVKKLRPQGSVGVHLVANKTEGWAGRPDGEDKWEELVRDCYPLGLGEPTAVSGSQGDGLEDLYRLLEPYGKAEASEQQQRQGQLEGDDDAVDGSAEAAAEEAAASAAVAPPKYASQLGLTSPASDVNANDEDDVNLPSDPSKRRAVEARLARAREGPIQLAIVGRPNAGKSTLVNQMLGSERVLAGPTPGLTRDAVTVDLPTPLADGRIVRLVDTAGMRRGGASDVTTSLEGAAVGLAVKALQRAHVVALVVDGSAGAPAGLTNERPVFRGEGSSSSSSRTSSDRQYAASASGRGSERVTGWGLTKQDLAIAEQVLDEGRGLVVVVNKVDALADRAAVIDTAKRQLESMHQGQGVEVVALSALKGSGVAGLMPAVLRTYDRWNLRVPTGKLNAWLRLTSRHHPPPSLTVPGKTRPGRDGGLTTSTRVVPLKLKYLTQITARPPTFALFANRSSLPENYSRFLVNALRKEFELGGTPIRLLVRTAENPYTTASKGKQQQSATRHAPLQKQHHAQATTSLEFAASLGGGAGNGSGAMVSAKS